MAEKDSIAVPDLPEFDSETDAEKNAALITAVDCIKHDDDPTRFTARSFAVIWNEGHSMRLINRDDPRKAISIPWDELDALKAILIGTRPIGEPVNKDDD